MKHSISFSLILFLKIFIFSSFILAKNLPTSDIIKVLTENDTHIFVVEVVSSLQGREKGLQGREVLNVGEGMLFNFPRPQIVYMWMHNTKIPLDMVFIKPNGRISKIVSNTIPYSKQIIHSDEKVKAVLEINSGDAIKLKIKAGHKVKHKIFE